MSSAVDVPCPNCEKTLRIPPAVFGKRVKCKHCGHAFAAADPAAAKPARPAKPGAKPPAPAAPPPAPAAKAGRFDDDDEGPQKIEVVQEDDSPRCPHCAKELIPPDARVCVHCGFNNLTREKAETKKVWAPDVEDWALHLAPGVIALAICIGLIVGNVIAFVEMREWLAGSFLEKDELDAAGRKTYYIHPRAFNFLILGISVPIFVPAVKFAYRRLAVEYRPEERVKK